jgi:hypothetical protein
MKRLMFVALAVLAACGDNKKPLAAADAGGGSAGPDAPSTPHAIVVAPPLNFGPPPGIMSELDVASQRVTQDIFAGVVGDDPFLRMYGGMLYVINRSDGDNITIIDATTLTFVNQIATGAGSNPQDVAVVGDKLYVPALGTAGVVVLSQSGGTMTGTIDLSGSGAANDPDGKPDCVSAFAVGTDVYVACDVYDETTFVPEGNGKLVVIDSTSDTARTTITMPVPNPQNEFVQLPDMDLMISAESFANNGSDEDKGCIVRIVPGTTPTAVCQIQNNDVDGVVNHMSLESTPKPVLWLAVEKYDFSGASLSTWDVLTATVANSISASTEMITDVAACPDGNVIAGDQTMNATGFRIFNGTTEVTTAALPFGLPPGDGNGMVCYDP